MDAGTRNTVSYTPVRFKAYPALKNAVLVNARYWRSFKNKAMPQHIAAVTANQFCPAVPHALSFTSSTRKGTKLKMRPVGVPTAKFELRPLPYELDALEPHMSKQTLEFHWGKHHRAYVDNLNKQVEGSHFEKNTLEEVVKISYNNGNPMASFNNAAQAWNHDFFWSSICPGGGGKPEGEVLELIERDFGSYEEFAKEFKQAGATQFGSGWVWLVLKDAKLAIVKTANALTPIIWSQMPLLVVDVWEHAYYLDFQNRRPDYVTTFLDDLVCWEAVGARLARAKAFVNLGEPTIPEK